MPALLLEIGFEDLPAEEAESVAQAFREAFARELQAARVPHGPIRLFWTLRRVALLVEGIGERQEDLVEEVRGPAAAVGLDAQGNLTPAGLGFLRRYGAAPADLVRKRLGDKEYLFLRVRRPGAPVAELLEGIVARALAAVPCSKFMRWEGPTAFLRPIRWVVALRDGEVVPLRLAGVEAGRLSQGHRFFGGPVALRHAADYAEALRAAKVLADPEERARLLRAAIAAVEQEHGAKAALSPELWTMLLGQTEWPRPVVGRIPAEFLELPEPVVVAALREEGKFVPFTRGGRIAEVFLGFAEGEGDPEVIRRGYERVVGIRLRDARAFFEEDRRRPLSARVPELQGVVYEARLGTLWDRVERIRRIARRLAAELGLPADLLDRAALLCKADLLTVMVREFPELEGVMGGIYAGLDGERPEVARAIAEHVRPRTREDPLPESPLGVALSLADKLDGVIGPIRVGEIPTGSRDPYAVRRRGSAAVRLILEKGLRLDLFALVEDVADLYPGTEPAARVKAFLWDRLRSALEERAIPYDVADAVMAQESGDFLGVWERAQALAAWAGKPELSALALAFSRVRNITKGQEAQGFRPELFSEDAERDLWRAYQEVGPRVDAALAQHRYAEALEALLRLKAPIDRYFDEVLVMCEDGQVRANRLGFLRELSQLFLRVADLSRLVVPG